MYLWHADLTKEGCISRCESPHLSTAASYVTTLTINWCPRSLDLHVLFLVWAILLGGGKGAGPALWSPWGFCGLERRLGCSILQLSCFSYWMVRSLSCWRFLSHITQCIRSVWKHLVVLHWGAGNEPEESRSAYNEGSTYNTERTNDPQQLTHKECKSSSQANPGQIIFLLSFTIWRGQPCHSPFANTRLKCTCW